MQYVLKNLLISRRDEVYNPLLLVEKFENFSRVSNNYRLFPKKIAGRNLANFFT